MGQAELTVENKSKQPSLLMTQYTSGRRGPFPVGCKRKEQTGWTKLCNEVRNLAEVRSEAAAASVNLRLCRRGGSLDETGGGAKFPGQTPLCVAVLTMKPLSKLCLSQV